MARRPGGGAPVVPEGPRASRVGGACTGGPALGRALRTLRRVRRFGPRVGPARGPVDDPFGNRCCEDRASARHPKRGCGGGTMQAASGSRACADRHAKTRQPVPGGVHPPLAGRSRNQDGAGVPGRRGARGRVCARSGVAVAACRRVRGGDGWGAGALHGPRRALSNAPGPRTRELLRGRAGFARHRVTPGCRPGLVAVCLRWPLACPARCRGAVAAGCRPPGDGDPGGISRSPCGQGPWRRTRRFHPTCVPHRRRHAMGTA